MAYQPSLVIQYQSLDFFVLMTNQPSFVNQSRSHSYVKTAVVLFYSYLEIFGDYVFLKRISPEVNVMTCVEFQRP